MGTIVCQSCKKPLAFFEGKKVTTLYAHQNDCTDCKTEKQK